MRPQSDWTRNILLEITRCGWLVMAKGTDWVSYKKGCYHLSQLHKSKTMRTRDYKSKTRPQEQDHKNKMTIAQEENQKSTASQE